MPTEQDVLSMKLSVLHEDVGEIKQALGKLSDAVTKLALVEERQTQATASMDRLFKSIEKLDARVDLLEKAQPDVQRAALWLDRITWAAVAGVAIFVASKTGLL